MVEELYRKYLEVVLAVDGHAHHIVRVPVHHTRTQAACTFHHDQFLYIELIVNFSSYFLVLHTETIRGC
jgi:hypothetical protein